MSEMFTAGVLCSSPRLEELKNFQTAYLVKCSNCRFVFSRKKPMEKELIEHYNQYGRNGYLSDLTVKRYEELLDGFEKYRKNNKILDVGCGIGYFLEVAQKRGWQVYGMEYTDKAIEICERKGIKMKRSLAEYTDSDFDIVTSFEVIEHINDPVDHLRLIKQSLRKQGALYITTPNFNSLLRYVLGEKYDIITYPEHLCYYTPKTLHYLLRQEQFTKRNLRTTGISLTRLKTSTGRSVQAKISSNSEDEKIRKVLEKNILMQKLKGIINFLLTTIGKGDAIKALYEMDKIPECN